MSKFLCKISTGMSGFTSIQARHTVERFGSKDFGMLLKCSPVEEIKALIVMFSKTENKFIVTHVQAESHFHVDLAFFVNMKK